MGSVMNLQELVAFGLSCGELIAGLSDGVGFDDVSKVVKSARLAGPALKDAKLAFTEYANMTDEQAKDIEAYVQENFDISDEGVEMAVKTALTVAMELHDLAKLFVKGA